MTTTHATALDRLEALAISGGSRLGRGGRFGVTVRVSDLRFILSERAELLATAERVRGLLKRMADLLEIANRSTDRPSGYVSRLVIDARAALTDPCICIQRGGGPEGCGVCNETGIRPHTGRTDMTAETQTVPLLPCPFCAGDAAICQAEHAFHDAKVRCWSCSTEGPLFDVGDGDEDEAGRNEAEAIAAWNRRHAPAPAGELREAVQAVLDRWDSPLWKDQEPTAVVMNRLRAALAAPGSEGEG